VLLLLRCDTPAHIFQHDNQYEALYVQRPAYGSTMADPQPSDSSFSCHTTSCRTTHPAPLVRQYLWTQFLRCTDASQRALWSQSWLATIACAHTQHDLVSLLLLPPVLVHAAARARCQTQGTHSETGTEAGPSF
jgi:hypothetical protein